MADAYDFVYALQDAGVYDVILPMILVFAIIFAILQKIEIFGNETKNKNVRGINFVVSLVLSLLILLPEHGLVDKLTHYLPRFTFIILLVVTGLILLGLLGANVHAGLQGWVFMTVLIVSILGLISINSEILPYGIQYFLKDNAVWILTVLGVILLFGLIVGGSGGDRVGNSGQNINTRYGLGGGNGGSQE